jgi:hypothetical protein
MDIRSVDNELVNCAAVVGYERFEVPLQHMREDARLCSSQVGGHGAVVTRRALTLLSPPKGQSGNREDTHSSLRGKELIDQASSPSGRLHVAIASDFQLIEEAAAFEEFV